MSFNRYTEEELFLVRPRYKLYTNKRKDILMEKIQNDIHSDLSVNGLRTDNRCFLSIPPDEQHYWSPEMQIEISERQGEEDYLTETTFENKNTLIRCVIGPKQKIWAMFIFGYSLAGVLTFFGGLYGFVQLNLGKPATFLWSIPIGGIMIAIIYLAAAVGRKKGHEQMVHLIRFLYGTIDDNEIERK